jgi:hypothetical protein
MKLEVSRQMFEKTQIRRVGAELFHAADGRT